MKKLFLVNGPNLNRLGMREPDIYGYETLQDLELELSEFAKIQGIEITCFQSNHEGVIIDKLHEANGIFAGVIINPGAFTHYSYAIRDAVASIQIPVIEVHISNVHAREEFRHNSVIAPVAAGQIIGLGFLGYRLAVLALIEKTRGK